jgi:predicted phage terminase large subunit-like protein
MQTLTPNQQQALREAAKAELAKRSLYHFVKQAWHVIDPGHPFVDNWHLKLLCDKLEAVTKREIKRLIINVPPRSGKSSIVCVLWPVWTWLQDPSHQWLTISHSGTFATRDALRSRRLIQSPWFQARWGRMFKLTGDQNQKTRYENDQRGYRIAVGITGGITGEGGDTILLDDPMDRDSAHSDLEREKANITYDEAISTRLNDPAAGAIVVIMQRLHELDTTGHLLAGEEDWDHLCLPMLYESDHPFVCAEDIRTEEDEPLWPERFTPDVIAAMRQRLQTYGFAGQAQQRPTPKGGGTWRTGWFNRWRELPSDLKNFTQSWDFAAKDTKDGSYNVGQVWAETGADKYLVDQVRFRGTFSEAKNAIMDLSAKWPQCRAKLIEDKANGSPILDSLQKTVGGMIATNPGKRGKVERAEAVAPFIEAGNIWVPADAPWVSDFMAEVEAFPNGANDDQIDAASQALERLCVSGHSGEAFEQASAAMQAIFG